MAADRAPAANPSRSLLSSDEACALLGIRRSTLYSYVSRGFLHCVHGQGTKRKLYPADEVARLAARSGARKGHAPVAAGALRFGEPVLDTAVCAVGEQGFLYRGRPVLALVEAGTSLEQLATLLWDAPPGEPWPAAPEGPARSEPTALKRMLGALTEHVLREEFTEVARPELERARARALLGALGHAFAPARGAGAGSLAQRLASGLGLAPAAARSLDAALVLAGDHELNASTFAARIAASTGASLAACLGAAMHTFTGPLHGMAPALVERLLEGLPAGRAAMLRALRARVAQGEVLPGFGHTLYPQGDPRAPPLLALAQDNGPRNAQVAHGLEAARAVHELTGLRPGIDLGLVLLAQSLGLPGGTATGLFALGRSVGWLAHVFEQRETRALLRPRARYVGVRLEGA